MSKLTKDVIKQLIAENLEEMGTTETPPAPQYTKDFQEGQMYQSAGGNKVIFKGGKLVPVEGTDPKYMPQIIRQAQLKGLRLAGQQTEVKENKVTKSYLLNVIKEEYNAMMNEITYRSSYIKGEYTGDPRSASGGLERSSEHDFRLLTLSTKLRKLDQNDPKVKEFSDRVGSLLTRKHDRLKPEEKAEIDQMLSAIEQK